MSTPEGRGSVPRPSRALFRALVAVLVALTFFLVVEAGELSQRELDTVGTTTTIYFSGPGDLVEVTP